jgi:mono/diheme cytochrome c family protein
MGPTAAFLKPYPRDYRPGIYKFKSTPSNYVPTHDDLMRVVSHGITGTAMPSFKLLPKDEVEALVEYVKYLSLRGQTEIALIDYAFQNLGSTEKIPTSQDVLVGEILKGPAGPVTKWENAASQVSQIPQPPANLGTRESIEKGKNIFYGAGGCVKCHGPTALGDGQLVWDDWNEKVDLFLKNIPKLNDELDKQEDEAGKQLSQEGISEAEKERLNDKLDDLDEMRRRLAEADVAVLPPRQSEPRNLRQGIYRGGRERFEIFYRLQNGILASKMPAIPTGTKPEDIWHVVDYVLALPYEPGSQYAPEVKAPERDRL